MLDKSFLTLRSFLAALTQLSAPLPPDLQAQLQAIGSADASLSDPGEALSALTRNHAELRKFYQQARAHLSLPATQRSKSARFIPNDATEQHLPSSEINNAYQDDRPLLAEFDKVLDQLEKASVDTVAKQLKAIAQADDSVQAARDMIVPPSW